MKGCPLRCLWCSNPESQKDHPEIGFKEGQCIAKAGCDLCKKSCPEGAIDRVKGEGIRIDRDLCTHCGQCAEVCPSKALQLMGRTVSVSDIMEEIEEDSHYFWRSGGGVTVGGGEPLHQADFVAEVLEACQDRGIERAIETCGHAPFEEVKKLCAHVNMVFYDIKHMDPVKHRAYTGVTNELILENIKKVSECFPEVPIIARTPIIPGFNHSPREIESIARFLGKIKTIKEYELLPYHAFGVPKYKQLGRKYPLSNLKATTQEQVAILKERIRKLKTRGGSKRLTDAGAE